MWNAWGVKCQLVAECGVDRHSNTRKGFSANVEAHKSANESIPAR